MIVRILFGLLVLAHGLVHLMGFVKAYGLAEIVQLTQAISRPAGLFWLAASVLFLAVGVLALAGAGWWWMVSVPALVLSQVLVVMWWGDARFGTVANVIVLAGAVLGYGSWSFRTMAAGEVASLLGQASAPAAAVNQADLAALPPPVQSWLRQAGVAGREAIRTVYLEQTGTMRTEPEGKWMEVEARQWFATRPPGFVWLADVVALPGIHLAGRDKYLDGKGHMRIELLSLVPVADSGGESIDQGAMLRYLAESVWFPTAALEDDLRWEPVDERSARATMTHGGLTASGVFRFDPEGRVVSFSARRYYDRKEGPTLEDWLIELDPNAWREFGGVRVPTRAQVTWRLDAGDFTWYKLGISSIRYDCDVPSKL